jgi:ketosteroid isomerase-like protein
VSDAATVEHVWSDDHTFTNLFGIVQTNGDRLAEIRSGTRRLQSFDIDDVRVRVYGDTAVVMSRGRLKGQRDGQAFDRQARGLNVYIKRKGRWQLVDAQATRIAQP